MGRMKSWADVAIDADDPRLRGYYCRPFAEVAQLV